MDHPSVSAVGLIFDEETTALAHKYYEEEGRPEGRALDHWLRAERDVRERDVRERAGTSETAQGQSDT